MDADPIREEAPGIFVLPTEDNLSIKMEALSQGFSLHCILGNCPKENLEVFFTELMNANLFGHMTRNCVLGLTEEGNQLTLSRAIDYNIEYKGFNEMLEDFYNICLFWKEQAVNNFLNLK